MASPLLAERVHYLTPSGRCAAAIIIDEDDPGVTNVVTLEVREPGSDSTSVQTYRVNSIDHGAVNELDTWHWGSEDAPPPSDFAAGKAHHHPPK